MGGGLGLERNKSMIDIGCGSSANIGNFLAKKKLSIKITGVTNA